MEQPQIPIDRPDTQRSAPEEFGRAFVGLVQIWFVLRPLVFAGGLGLLCMGTGVSLTHGLSGPEMMGWGGVLVGLGLAPRRRDSL
jgi:hypothetical protein